MNRITEIKLRVNESPNVVYLVGDIYDHSAKDDLKYLLSRLDIAVEALERFGPKWLYWPAKKQPDPRTVLFDSRTINEIEKMASKALAKVTGQESGK